MYSVVLLVAATSGGDMASFGGSKGSGCTGYTAGCTGYTAGCHGSSCHGSGFLGMKSSGGLFSKHKGGCHGSTYAGSCTGAPVVASAPPVATTPVGCTGYTAGCTGYTAGCHGSSCHGGGFLGLRNSSGGGLFSKHKGGCSGSCHGW
ncbi:hypothetical protein [Frigoriglobus tundricola]|uniref:Uncharacterized protein n=1 Tax=Frigoriglobus tundricola TaxID=2774151 RepID=A0A6M5YTI7_9BACT|nr:hypothetical protein [Frigoriglobus tundricola]QJW97407.1 hypothetical protein FTUN_4981 [Frigoriglobus tundricola]